MNKNTKMNFLLVLSNSSFIKLLYGSVFTVSTVSLVQTAQINDQSFFEALSNSIPTQVMSVLGILSGIIFVLGYASKVWKQHKMNLTDISVHEMKMKEALEHLEREEILTEKEKESLKKIQKQ